MILGLLYYFLFGVAVALGLWYLWGWISGTDRQNKTWIALHKKGEINKAVAKASRKYPDKERFLMFWLQLQRLKKELPDEGVMAELGVYQAETAVVLQAIAPERALWLFDTFEGFRNDDLKEEFGNAKNYDATSFADTSVALIMEKLNHAGNVNIFKGNFADISSQIPEQKYALVSIDADLAAPTIAGLQYFWPRLLPGGVIVVHDFNPEWPALMQAVEQFLTTITETPVLIPDRDNSLVIVKNKTN